MEIEIRRFRLSFMWVETFLDLLAEQPPNAPMKFLGRRYTYEQEIQRLLDFDEASIANGCTLPWQKTRLAYQHFWRNYLHKEIPPTAKLCWDGLVPIRMKFDQPDVPTWLPGRIFYEGFFFPYGTALGITATLEGSFSLDQMVEYSRMIRKTGKFLFDGGGIKPRAASLNTIADRNLAFIRKMALGSEAKPGHVSETPFSILTVLTGSGVDPTKPFRKGGTVHRALEAVTCWNDNFAYISLPPLGQVRLPSRKMPSSHIIYFNPRGRANWFPGDFTNEEEGKCSLGCYHRNSFFSALMIESLSSFASTIVALPPAAMRNLSQAQNDCALRIARLLGSLYGGAHSTYRSWGPRRHIELNGLHQTVDQLRKFCNLDPLYIKEEQG